jgi:hypothetical protein
MAYKDPERRKSYLREYRKANRARIAAYDRNRNSWRYFRLKNMIYEANERLLAQTFGRDKTDGISIVGMDELDDPAFIVIGANGRLTSERLRAGAQEKGKP